MADSWCVTDYPMSSLSYKWTIKNFRQWYLIQQSNKPLALKSPTFPNAPGHDDTFKWHLEVSINFFDSFISLHIVLEQKLDFRVWAEYKFSILSKGEEKHTKATNLPNSFSVGTKHGYNSFIRKDILLDKANGFLPEDTLTLFCEMRVYLLKNPVEHVGSKHQIDVPTFDLGSKLGSALKEDCFSDVTLVVGSKQFKAHKVILAVQSPVFKAMFESEMMESNSNRVEIDDINEKLMEETLTFIYTGKAPNVDQMASELLFPADKYQLDHLKLMCEEVLCRNVKVENVVDVLVLADKHNANQLKTVCLKFIATHASETMQTPSWKSLKPAQEYHSLVTEVFEATMTKHCMQLY